MKTNILTIQKRIRDAALAVGRPPESVRLVAVSKTVAAGRVREAVQAGITLLGENYIQEAREKIEALQDLDVSWHFIGHLQSNKAKYAVRMFDMTGKEIYAASCPGTLEHRVLTKEYRPGIYFVSIETEGEVFTKKVVIR